MAKNLFQRAAAYRRKHKNVSQAEAVKIVSREDKKSPKRRKHHRVGRVAAAPKKRTVILPVSSLGGHRKRRKATHTKVATSRTYRATPQSKVQRGQAVVRCIERYEEKLKNTRNPDERKLLIHAINAEHDKLDRITASMRRRAS